MTSINKAMILGRLGQNPELRFTANQQAVATFSVATSEYRMKDGQRQEQTEWHRVVVWGKQAENCAKYLSKGRMVFVEGRIQTRQWDDKTTGQKRFATEIIGLNVQFVSAGQGQQQDYQGGYMSDSAMMGEGDPSGFGGSSVNSSANSHTPNHFPSADRNQNTAPSANGFGMGGGDFDDIPF